MSASKSRPSMYSTVLARLQGVVGRRGATKDGRGEETVSGYPSRSGAVFEAIEPRILLSAMSYEAVAATALDATLKIVDESGIATLELIDNASSAVLASQAITEDINVTISANSVSGYSSSDKLFIDFSYSGTPAPEVAINLDFDGVGPDLFGLDDQLIVSGPASGLYQAKSINIDSADDVVVNGGLLASGKVDINASERIDVNAGAILSGTTVSLTAKASSGGVLESLGLDPAVLANSTAEINVHGGEIDGSTGVVLLAQSDVSVDTDGFSLSDFKLALLAAESHAVISIDGATLINAGTDGVQITSISNVTKANATAKSDAGGDAAADAAAAMGLLTSEATATLGGTTTVNSTGDVVIQAQNTATMKVDADGSKGGATSAGASYGAGALTSITNASVSGATVTTAGALNVVATATNKLTVSAEAATQGAKDDADPATKTRTEQGLEDNDASTSKGDIKLAAALAVAGIDASTLASIDGGAVIVATGTVKVTSTADNTASADGDASAVESGDATGVGVAVAINNSGVTSSASIAGLADVTARKVDVGAQEKTAKFSAKSTAGAGSVNVAAAGAVAVNQSTVNVDARIQDTAAVHLGGGDFLLQAKSVTDTSAIAKPQVKTKDSGVDGGSTTEIGVGAAFAFNVDKGQTLAVAEDGAIVDGTAADVTVAADAKCVSDSEAEAGAQATGAAAVGGAIAISDSDHDVAARMGSDVTITGTGSLKLTSSLDDSVNTKTSGTVAGDQVGLGVSAAFALVSDTNAASLAGSVQMKGVATAQARSKVANTNQALATARGAADTDPDADSETASNVAHANAKTGGSTASASADSEVSKANGAIAEQNAASDSSAGTAGSVKVAAGLAFSSVDSDVTAELEDHATLEAQGGMATVAAEGEIDSSTQAFGLTAAVGAGGGAGIGVGAAVGFNIVGTGVGGASTLARVGIDASLTGDGVTVEAVTPDNETNEISTWALGGAGVAQSGGGASHAVAGSVGINSITMTTDALVDGIAILKSTQDTTIAARNDTGIVILAGGAAASISETANTVGGAIAFNDADISTTATLGGAQSDAAGATTISADAQLDRLPIEVLTLPTDPVTAVAMGGAGSGGAGIAGSVIVNLLDENTVASIDNGAWVNQQQQNGTASQDVNVLASDNTDTSSIAGALGVSIDSSSVGAGVVVQVNDKHTDASIGDLADVHALGSVTVRADASEEIHALSVAAAIGDSLAVAGAVNRLVNNGSTRALIGDNPNDGFGPLGGTSITASGNVVVEAIHDSQFGSTAGNVSVGFGSAGVGAAVSSVAETDETLAAIAEGTSVTAHAGRDAAQVQTGLRDANGNRTTEARAGVVVSATSFEDLNSIAVGVSGGSEIGIGGSVTDESLNETTAASIGADAIINDQLPASALQDVVIRAADSSDLLAVAGAAEFGGSAGFGAGVDIGLITKDTRATLGTASVVRAAGDVVIDAQSTEQVVSVSANGNITEGATLVATGSEYDVDTGTRAFIEDGESASGASVTAQGDVLMLAGGSFASKLIAGGLSFGDAAGFGASNTTLIHDDTVESYIGRAASVDAFGGDAGGVQVSATSDETLLGVAAAGGGAITGGGAMGSATVEQLDEQTRAFIADEARVNLRTAGGVDGGAAGNQAVLVSASDETKSTAIAGAVAGGGEFGFGGSMDVMSLAKSTEAWIGGATVRAVAGIDVLAASTEDVASFAVSAGAGGAVGVAGSGSVQALDLSTRAFIGDDPGTGVTSGVADARTAGTVVINAFDTTEIDVLSGTAAGGAQFGGGGSAAVVTMDKDTQAFIGEAAVVSGLGRTTGVSYTGRFLPETYGADSGSSVFPQLDADGDLASGDMDVTPPDVSAIEDISGDSSRDALNDPSLTQQRHLSPETAVASGVAVAAISQEDVETLGASGGGGMVGVNLAGNVNALTSNTSAFIGQDAQVNVGPAGAAAQSVLVGAGHDGYLMGLVAVASGGFVGVGVNADIALVNSNTSASIADGSVVHAVDDVTVSAYSRVKALSLGFAVAGGSVGVSSPVSVFSLTSLTSAHIGSHGAISGQGAVVQAGGNVQVLAEDDTASTTIDGSIGGGATVGVGHTVSVTLIDKTTESYVGDFASIDAQGHGTPMAIIYDGKSDGKVTFTTSELNGLSVQAISSEDVFVVSAAMAGGYYAGVAGAVSVQNIDSDTDAHIGEGALINQAGNNNASADSRQSVNVSALNTLSAFVFTGGAAGGIGALAAGVNVGTVRNDTSAAIRNGASVRARSNVDVNALASKDIQGLVLSGAFGGALAGSISAWTLGSAVDSSYEVEQSDTDGSLQPARHADAMHSVGGNPDQVGDANAHADEQAADLASAIDRYPASGTSRNAQLQDSLSHQAALNIGTANPVGKSQAAVEASGADAAAGTTAYIGDGAGVNAGASVGVRAEELIAFDGIAGSVALGAGMGASIAVVTVNSDTDAYIGAAAVHAGSGTLDNVEVLASLDDELTGHAWAGQGGGGPTLGADVMVISDRSVQNAHIDAGANIDGAGGAVTVTARADRLADAQAPGVGVSGVAAMGASVAVVNQGGETRAFAQGDIGRSAAPAEVDITAESLATANAQAVAVEAGPFTGTSGSVAVAHFDPVLEASTRSGASVTAQNNIRVKSHSAADVNAVAVGVDASAGAALGASIAIATATPVHTAQLGGDLAETTGGGEISVEATHGQNVRTDGLVSGVYARAVTGAAGSLEIAGSVALAESSPVLDASVRSGTILRSGGNVRVTASATNTSVAKADGAGLGLIGVGVSYADSHIGGHAISTLDGATDAAGNVTVEAAAVNRSTADAWAAQAGLHDADLADAISLVDMQITAAVGPAIDVRAGLDVVIDAASDSNSVADADAAAATLSTAAAGAIAKATLVPEVAARVGAARILAGRDIAISARHNRDANGVVNGSGARATASAPAGSIIFTGTGAFATALAQTVVEGEAEAGSQLVAGQQVEISARSSNDANADGNAGDLSAISAGTVQADATAAGITRAHADGGVRAGAGGGVYGVDILSQSGETAYAEADSTGIGLLFSGFGASANALVNPLSGGFAAGTAAYVGAGGSVTASGDVSVNAQAESIASSDARGTSAGALAFSTGHALSSIDTSVSAYLGSGATIDAGGAVTLAAQHNTDDQGTPLVNAASATAYAPGGGGISVKFTEATAESRATTDAYAASGSTIHAGGDLSVLSDSSNVSSAVAKGVDLSAFGYGHTKSAATANGVTRAHVDGDVAGRAGAGAGSVTVNADGNNQASALSKMPAFGLAGALEGISAIAEVRPTIHAYLAGNQLIDASGTVQVHAGSVGLASSDTEGFATGVVAGIETSTSKSYLTPDVQAFIGAGAAVTARRGSVLVDATHNTGQPESMGAFATAHASSVAGLAVSGAVAEAYSTPTVDARVDSDAVVSAGDDLSVNADMSTRARTDARGIGVGVDGVGAGSAKSYANGLVRAHSEGDLDAGRNISLAATGSGDAEAVAKALAGGVLSGDSAVAIAEMTPAIQAFIGGTASQVDAGGEVRLDAVSIGWADANVVGTNVTALGVGTSKATATLAPALNAWIGNASVTAIGGGIQINARHNEGLSTTRYRANADASASAGSLALNFNGTHADADAQASVDVHVDGTAHLTARDAVTLSGWAQNVANANAHGISLAIGFSVGTTSADAVAGGDGHNDASVDVRLAGVISSAGGVAVNAQSVDVADAFADAVVGGELGGGAATNATATVDHLTKAQIADGAQVSSDGVVSVTSVSNANANSEGTGVVAGLATEFGVGKAAAIIQSVVTALIGNNASVTADGVSVLARHNRNSDGTASGEGATATAWAAGGSLGAAFNEISAPATAAADVEASVGSGSRIISGLGNVDVIALSSNVADSVPKNLGFGGGLGIGYVHANATADGVTLANLDGSVGDAGTRGAFDVSVVADDISGATATGKSAQGSLFVAGDAVLAESTATPSVEAHIGGNAVVNVWRDVQVNANAVASAEATASGTAISGAFTVGTSTARATLTPHVTASIDGTTEVISAGGSLYIDAQFNTAGADGARATATNSDGSLGLSVGGANAEALLTLDVDAHTASTSALTVASDINVSALSSGVAIADSDGLDFSTVGVGESRVTASITGAQLAYLQGTADAHHDIVLTNTTDSAAEATAHAVSGALGVDVMFNKATATVDPVQNTYLNGTLSADNDILVTNLAAADAYAESAGTSVSLLFGDRNNRATATLANDVNAWATGTITGGHNVFLRSRFNVDEVGFGQAGKAEAQSKASGGSGVVDGASTHADAMSGATVRAHVDGAGTVVSALTGATQIDARAKNEALANVNADDFAAGAAIGSNQANAGTAGMTLAFLGSGAKVGGADLDIFAVSAEVGHATTDTSSGGIVLGVSAATSSVELSPLVNGYAASNSVVDVSGDVTILAQSYTDGDSTSEGASFSGLFNSGSNNADGTELSVVNAEILNGAQIDAGGSVAILARHNTANLLENGFAAGADGLSEIDASSSGGSVLLNDPSGKASINFDSSVTSQISGNARVTAGTDITLDAQSLNLAIGTGTAAGGGAIGMGNSDSTADVDQVVLAAAGDGSNLDAGGSVNIITSSEYLLSANSDAHVGGLASDVSATSKVNIDHDEQSRIGDGASVHADQDVQMDAHATFGGGASAIGDNGGLSAVAAADARYVLDGSGARQLTAIIVGGDADVQAGNNVSMTALVDTLAQLMLISASDGGSLFGGTAANTVAALHSLAEVVVGSGATVSGGDSIVLRAEHAPLSIFGDALANGTVFGSDDAWVTVDTDGYSVVTGAAGATFVTHNLTVSSLRYFDNVAYGPGVDADHSVLQWTWDRRIHFDSDVVITSGDDVALVIDANGVVTEARNVTVDGGHGVGYVTHGATVSVDDISNAGSSAHVLFDTNPLSLPLIATFNSSIDGTLGTYHVRHSIGNISLVNYSVRDLVVNNIIPIDYTPDPVTVDINVDDVTYEFDIVHEFAATDILIDGENIDRFNSVQLSGLIDNPVGATRVVSRGQGIGATSSGIIRSNTVILEASNGSIGSTLPLPPPMGDLRQPLIVELVQSEGLAADLNASAVGMIVLDITGLQRDPAAADFTLDMGDVVAGGNVDLALHTGIEQTSVVSVAGYALTVDLLEPSTGNDPAPDDYLQHFRPDTGTVPQFDPSLEGVSGSGGTPIKTAYFFQMIQAGGDIDIVADQPGRHIDITAQTNVTGSGNIDVSTNGLIWLGETVGDMRVGAIYSSTDDVTLWADGSIIDEPRDPEADVSGFNITLVSFHGSIGVPCFDGPDGHVPPEFLEIDILPSKIGLLNATAHDDIFINEVDGDLLLAEVTAETGDVALGATHNGSILDGNDVGAIVVNVTGNNIDFFAPQGSIGLLDLPIEIDSAHSGPGVLSAVGREGVAVAEVNDSLDVLLAVATFGSVSLSTLDEADTGQDLTVLASGETATCIDIANGGILALGNVELKSGDNVTIEEGSTVVGGNVIFIYGDYGKADPGVGSVIVVEGQLLSPSIEVYGGSDDDWIILRNMHAGHILLDGQSGDDAYVVNLSGVGNYEVDVFDSSASSVDALQVIGTDNVETLLARAGSDPVEGVAFVASIHFDATGNFSGAERINYNHELEELVIDARGGDDFVQLDDNWAPTLVYAGIGADTIQVGELYATPRDAAAGLDPRDVFSTTPTTQGYLSNGVSFGTLIQGQGGDDTIKVYSNQAPLAIFGDDDDDTVEIRSIAIGLLSNGKIGFTSNEAVIFDGAAGIDTLNIVGSEFGDHFLVTANAIYSEHRIDGYLNVEAVNIDGAEGDDWFFVLSTQTGTTTTLTGGLGLDHFIVLGGQVITNQFLLSSAPLRTASLTVNPYETALREAFPDMAVAGFGDLSTLDGELIIDGAAGQGMLNGLRHSPLMLSGERDEAAADGQVEVFRQGATLSEVVVSTAALDAARARLGFNSNAALIGLDLRMTSGAALGRFWRIVGMQVNVADGSTTLTVKNPGLPAGVANVRPDAGSRFVVGAGSDTFFVDQDLAQPDMVALVNSGSQRNATIRVSRDGYSEDGLGGAVHYRNTGVLDLQLGAGDDTVIVAGLPGGSGQTAMNTIATGAGDDRVLVSLGASDGGLSVNLEDGDDVFDASGSTHAVTVDGGAGRDSIRGGAGNDELRGGDGDDDLIGGLGDDTLHGEGGQDVILGDQGRIVHAVDANGNPVIDSTTGSEHRDVLLIDAATVAGSYALDATMAPDRALVQNLVEADVALLVARDGSGTAALGADPRVLLMTLMPAGNDTLDGGEGDDVLFGQRGNDSLAGDSGNDFLVGGLGNDVIGGGAGNDTMVGDDAWVDTDGGALPDVIRGFVVDHPIFSTEEAIVPLSSMVPGRENLSLYTLLPQAFGYSNLIPAHNGIHGGAGGDYLALAAITTDLAHHGATLNGDDHLSGNEGNDTVIGDNLFIHARSVDVTPERMLAVERLTRALLQTGNAFAGLINSQRALIGPGGNAGAVVFDRSIGFGNDVIDAGAGNDVVTGDNSALLAATFHVPARLASGFGQFLNAISAADDVLANGVYGLMRLEHQLRNGPGDVRSHADLLLTGNDLLIGGDGNDLLVGDDYLFKTVQVNVTGTAVPPALQNRNWNFGTVAPAVAGGPIDAVRTGRDQVTGGAGDDLVFGDNLALTAASISRSAGVTDREFSRARNPLSTPVSDLAAVTDRTIDWRKHGFTVSDPQGAINWEDNLDGGDGNDVLFGRAGRDLLNGRAGDDWLIGGQGADGLNGGAGRNQVSQGENGSTALRNTVRSRMVQWDHAFGQFGLPRPPLAGAALKQSVSHTADFDYLEFVSLPAP